MRCYIIIFSKFKYFFILYFKIIHKQLPEIVYQSLKNTYCNIGHIRFRDWLLNFSSDHSGKQKLFIWHGCFLVNESCKFTNIILQTWCTACPNKGCGTFTVQNLHSYCNHSAHCLSDTTYYGNVLRNVYWYLNHQEEWPTRKCYRICLKCSTFNCLEEEFVWLITLKECLCKLFIVFYFLFLFSKILRKSIHMLFIFNSFLTYGSP